MNASKEPRPFPIPVISAIGPGSQVEDEQLQYLAMPKGMQTYRPPILPDLDEVHGAKDAIFLVHNVLKALDDCIASGAMKKSSVKFSLDHLNHANLQLVNQILGEGEVSAQIFDSEGRTEVKIQEAVFAGVWRVIEFLADGSCTDSVEIGSVPEILSKVAQSDGLGLSPYIPSIPQLHNIPSILIELEDQRKHWLEGQLAHVINLSLLPVSNDDIGYLDMALGTGRILILSRGYGNCRITNCCVPNTWRVVYYNSQDSVILNTVEVTSMPEVVCAAMEDLQDSRVRLREVLEWIEHE